MSKEWEAAIKRAIEKDPKLGHPVNERRRNDYYGPLLKKYIQIPVIIGIAAAVISYYLYGGVELLKKFLDWMIGITLFATIYALISRKKN